MSVTSTQKLLTATQYGSLGVIESSKEISVDVTYTVVNIDNITADSATAYFDVAIGGDKTNKRFAFTFPYSGEGAPLSLAEAALKSYLDSAS